ncbi:MAG: hypothetical protein AAF990_00930 [Bacteroidota bacterium]
MKSWNSLLFLAFFFFLSIIDLQAQGRVYDNKGRVLLPVISIGNFWPAADMEKRFGRNFELGLGLEMVSEKNWIIGLDYQFYFGNTVKEDVISNLRTPDGLVIGNTRSLAFVELRQRGFYAGGYIGKLIGIIPDNHRSGIRITVGAGLLQHKIRIQDDPDSFVPALDDTYKKGYDRLTNGLALQQFIGYQHLSRNRLINFYLGLEIIEGFTQNRRSFNFDDRAQDTAKRLDILYGIKAGWSLPFYLGEKGEEIFY